MVNPKILIVSLALFSASSCLSVVRSDVTVTGLQCEYLTDPLGIDVATPRFTWKLEDSDHTRGQKQTGYHVLVASSAALLAQDHGDIWDSGAVSSSQSALVLFAGSKLRSSEDCYWKVKVLDKDTKPTAWSAPAFFSIGLLDAKDWAGPWIKHPTELETSDIWYRKTFTLPEKPTRALIYVASIGYHELYVNGKKAGTQVLTPALSRLDKRVFYITYDIAPLLQAGQNCIGIWTGTGWADFKPFHVNPALRVQLNLKNAAGTVTSLTSDTTWKCTSSGSAHYSEGGKKNRDYGNNYGGETIDAQKYDPNWCTTTLDDNAWAFAAEAPVKVQLSDQMANPSRIFEDIPAQTVEGAGPYKVTLAKNFSGWVSIVMRNQSAGDTVEIQVSDNPRTVQAFGQKSIYICRGGGAETFQNRFNYTGGRFVTITGLKNKPGLADVVGHAIGNDMQRTGHFTCSSDLFNQIYETDLWTYRADTVTGFTQDCPHRERKGYGEENFASAWGCGLPNYNAGAFYTNAVRSWCDMQEADGSLPPIAPQTGPVYGGPIWSSSPLNMGWEFYKVYGDQRILADSYPTYKAFMDLMAANVADGILQPVTKIFTQTKGSFLGDWARPNDPTDRNKGKEMGKTPEALLFNSCVYAMDLRTFIDVAKILGKTDDVNVYSRRLEDFKATAQAHFFDPTRNIYIDTRQIHLAFPIFSDITPDHLKPAVMANFQKEISETRPYLDMGSSGLPILLKFLIEDVEDDSILFTHLSKTTQPSYGFFLSNGETAWPEYWDDTRESRIHTCYTGIAAYFIKGLGGIREDPAQFGYQSFIIKPALVGDMTFADAKMESLYGVINDRWEKKDGSVQMNVTIPVNSTAQVYVPAKDVANVTESGVAASSSPGLTFQKMDGGYAVFRAESGVYKFVSK